MTPSESALKAPGMKLDEDTGEVLGKCRENFKVVSTGSVDEEVRELRHREHPNLAAIEGRPETVLCYTKNVTLASRNLSEHLAGTNGLTDIIRFNFQR